MIRTSTIVYLVLLLVLVGAFFYLRNREVPAEAEPTPEAIPELSYVFKAEQGTPSGIRVEAQSGEVVEIARDAEASWVLKEPVEDNAQPATAEAAATQLVTMQILETLPDIAAADVGLEPPQYVVRVEFGDGSQQTLEFGIPTPSGSGYYARLEGGEVVIVSLSAVDALLALLQNPPYLETPTPGPETAVPATVTATP